MFGMGGEKNHVHAEIRHSGEKKGTDSVFSVEGNWTDTLTFKDGEGQTIDAYNVSSATSTDFRALPLDQQDPWESRKAWAGTISSLHSGNMQGVADHKSKLENAQRELRKKPETKEENWKALFYRKENDDPVARKLLESIGKKLDAESTCGVWKFDREKWETTQRPWRGDLTPYG